jgi:hypothetical protein
MAGAGAVGSFGRRFVAAFKLSQKLIGERRIKIIRNPALTFEKPE